ncbi:hypothetical protein EDB19DRAFT_1826641 [Suillus lakei]|nr:hypothetical protein EDB19DRAFT_1826641 [Suillus lakei]
MTTPFKYHASTRETSGGTDTSPEPEIMDVDIHECDFMHFVHIGFATSIAHLAHQHGFQEIIIQNIYKQLKTYVEVMDVVEAMKDAADDQEDEMTEEDKEMEEDEATEEEDEATEEEDEATEEDEVTEKDGVKEDKVKEEESDRLGCGWFDLELWDLQEIGWWVGWTGL